MSHSDTHHSFSVEIAIKYGLEQATLIHHFQHWIKLNRRKKSEKHFREGKWWMFQKRADIQATLPYLTEESIRHHCDELVKKNVLIKGNFNKFKIDKTIWYAFVDENEFLGKEDSNNVYERGKPQSSGENPNRSGENPNAIPDPNSNPKSLTVCPQGGGHAQKIGKIKRNTIQGEEFEVDQSDIFRFALHHPDWTTQDIQEAWKILVEYQGPVNNWQRFIEGTIENLRSKNNLNKLRSLPNKKTSRKEPELCKATPMTSEEKETYFKEIQKGQDLAKQLFQV